jgi:hypothetical protein
MKQAGHAAQGAMACLPINLVAALRHLQSMIIH